MGRALEVLFREGFLVNAMEKDRDAAMGIHVARGV